MKQSGREERTMSSRMSERARSETTIRSIHSNLIYVVVAAIIIAIIVMFNFSRQGLLGPIRGDGNSNPVVIWSISDHTSVLDPLINTLNATDTPKYQGDEVLSLTRNPDGSLQALPRFQGTLEYHAR